MTIGELMKDLKRYPANWQVTIPAYGLEQVDEQGNVISAEITGVLHQNYFDDQFANEFDELLIY
jgi:hypothetical protein